MAKGAMGADEASAFCEQISLLLSSGMPMHEGLDALAEGYRGMRDYPRMKRMADEVERADSLARAMRASGMFPDYMLEMTAIGERAGKLEWVMRELSEYYKRDAKVRRALKSAIAYPLVLLAMMASVIGVLILKVLPVFRQVFASLGVAGGMPPDALMRAGMRIGLGVLIAASAALLIALGAWLLSLTGARERLFRLLLRAAPPVRRLSEGIAAQRFAGVMAMMVGSGFPIEEALVAAPAIVGPGAMREKLNRVGELTRAGRSFPQAIQDVQLFSPVYNRMVAVGFSAGHADAALSKVAEVYEDEVDDNFAVLVSTIEPTLVAFLAILVGAILLSVMLPMASVLSGML